MVALVNTARSAQELVVRWLEDFLARGPVLRRLVFPVAALVRVYDGASVLVLRLLEPRRLVLRIGEA